MKNEWEKSHWHLKITFLRLPLNKHRRAGVRGGRERASSTPRRKLLMINNLRVRRNAIPVSTRSPRSLHGAAASWPSPPSPLLQGGLQPALTRPSPPRRPAPPAGPPPAPTRRSAPARGVRWLGDAPGKRSPPRAGGATAPDASGGGDFPGAAGGGREERCAAGGRAGRAGTGCRREGDMDRSEQGLLRTDPVPEEGEDVAATIGATETLSEEEREELRRELAKVEEEIQTLSQVLAAKEKHLAEIKRKLGINSLQELKQNIAKGWQDVTATSAYKKTSETLSQAGQKASAAFSSVGSVITKKLEDVNIRSIQHSISMPAMRNSPTFKSFEEKVENLKSKVGGNKPAGGDFGEVLNSTASASATTTEPLPEQTQEGL
ncbi:tumor protein D52 isoform X2 [Bos indicus]|uniref:Tumor protein D52 n=3 Tax=Bos TaxID=9903 RepID=A0A4W2CKP6_BOBOX|nr:tumor protein D52 isoform X2 [Bos taurus]